MHSERCQTLPYDNTKFSAAEYRDRQVPKERGEDPGGRILREREEREEERVREGGKEGEREREVRTLEADAATSVWSVWRRLARSSLTDVGPATTRIYTSATTTSRIYT